MQNNLTQTGKPKTSSANDTTVSRKTLVHIIDGSAWGMNTQDAKIPDIIPKPPVRGTALRCSERSFGWSSIRRTPELRIRYRTNASVTVNATSGAMAIESERSAAMVPAYNC